MGRNAVKNTQKTLYAPFYAASSRLLIAGGVALLAVIAAVVIVPKLRNEDVSAYPRRHVMDEELQPLERAYEIPGEMPAVPPPEGCLEGADAEMKLSNFDEAERRCIQ